MARLIGKRALVTGGATGIGREIVRLFIQEGACVAIADLHEPSVQAMEKTHSGAVRAFRCDVSRESDAAATLAAATSWLGGLDILVNNAGVQVAGCVTEMDVAEWDRVMAVNARGCFLMSKYAVPHLQQAKGGSIINTSSVAGQRGGPGASAYSASKGAIIAFSIALALELAPDAIRVNAVCPGWVDTPFNDPIASFMGGSTVQRAVIAATVPLGRQGTPEDIAPFYVFLASEEASYVTAKAFGVDGGLYS
ncbi:MULTISPECIES: SDR family NAD(P)-dependent oxidoreductase [Burkholderiaceae]|uniref:SDR family NAD(P)-dependent oxidoreductase n=1 Tax=Burkholderiaceae TaxID=119060 RepID=UPI00057C77C4|nr:MULTISPECIES: SDR family NAD(P)-dependent oxidoreductase [Burkholderiaceae]KHS13881.1 short-chain dehydrogenase [Burkholderia multivorans]MDR9227699.1 Dihydroanticapsin 7-dehydrogenase [Burkholderia multivorans]PRF10175.1 SDR family NAD(P)-dependent oxidoreductase [Burkholderia multivorans]USX10783.1 SDR family oxidoreductase [Paraburkholderia fungorum]HDR9471909.1 SDR family oxidoreductase [Burkholderia multivorans]